MPLIRVGGLGNYLHYYHSQGQQKTNVIFINKTENNTSNIYEKDMHKTKRPSDILSIKETCPAPS